MRLRALAVALAAAASPALAEDDFGTIMDRLVLDLEGCFFVAEAREASLPAVQCHVS